MWRFHRIRALLYIAFQRYLHANESQFRTSDIETLVRFENVIEGNFAEATDELLDEAFNILRNLYQSLHKRQIQPASTKETVLLLQAVCGKESPNLDYERLNEIFSDGNFKRGLDGLEAEFHVLKIEIEAYRKSPVIYERLYRQSRKLYFDYHSNEIDSDGKIRRALNAVPDVELQREAFLAYFTVRTSPANTNDLYNVCLHIALDCHDERMISDFIYPAQRRGRKKKNSFHDFIKTRLDKLARQGIITLPTKNVLYKTLEKLRDDVRVRAHFQKLQHNPT